MAILAEILRYKLEFYSNNRFSFSGWMLWRKFVIRCILKSQKLLMIATRGSSE